MGIKGLISVSWHLSPVVSMGKSFSLVYRFLGHVQTVYYINMCNFYESNVYIMTNNHIYVLAQERV